jgi:hypothetical protein
MSIYAQPGATFETSAVGFATGLTGTAGVRITDGAGATTTARTTSGISEFPASSGIYIATLTAPTTAGQFQVVWDSGGGSPSYAVEDLVVTSTGAQVSTPSGTDLVTLADVRRELEMPVSDTTRDDLTQTVITQVSRAIATYCQREFRTSASGSTTRRFRIPAPAYFVDLNPYDLNSAAGLTVVLNPDDSGGGTTLTANTDYRLNPLNPDHTYTSLNISRDVSQIHTGQDARKYGYTIAAITSAAWGFASVPDDVKRAAIIAVAANIDRRLDAFGGVQDLVDSDVGIQPLRAPSFALPTATMALVAPYRRTVGAF